MAHRKKTDTGGNERLALLREVFPNIQRHFEERPSGVAKDDLLDAAAAWTALRILKGEARRVCEPERSKHCEIKRGNVRRNSVMHGNMRRSCNVRLITPKASSRNVTSNWMTSAGKLERRPKQIRAIAIR